jgi:hypothetical protein
VDIRTFQLGDESEQAAIFNEAAGELPRFKPATSDEVARRCQAPGFDAGTRFFALEGNRPIGYATFHPSGRVSYPWCRKGFEKAADPLFRKVLDTMAERGLKTAFAAYRADWVAQKEFFRARGFRLAREMVNFVLDQVDMPTRPGRRNNPLTPLQPEDLPALLALAPQVVRVRSVEHLKQHLLHNPFFGADAAFALRSWNDRSLLAVGLLVANPAYADPMKVDTAMPCFRLGAFGTECLDAKRINGLFSFVVKDPRDANLQGLDLMGHAASLFEQSDGGPLAAQAPSNVTYLMRFYQDYFRRQGSFPVFEKAL